MAVIQGGNVIRGGLTTPGVKQRMYQLNGAPVNGAGGTILDYPGLVVGDLVTNVVNGQVYEYTFPASVHTFTRIDTL